MGRVGWSSALLVLAASALFVPARARAEPGTATLYLERGDGAEGCEDAAALRERINRIAEREAIVRGAAPLRLTLRFEHTREPKGFHALLHVSSSDPEAPTGNREFSDVGQTCLALDEAIAVSVALLLDNVVRAPQGIPDEPEPDPGPLRPPGGPVSKEYSERPRPRATFDVSAIVSAGIVGSSTFGLDLGFDFRATKPAVGPGIAPYLTVGLGMLALVEDVEPTAGGEVHVHLAAGRVPACFAFHLSNQAFGASFCGFPALGTMIASGRGYAQDTTAYQPWFALGASAVVDAAIIGPLSFTGRVLFVAPLVRPSFVLLRLGTDGDTQEAFEPYPVGVASGVGIRAIIP